MSLKGQWTSGRLQLYDGDYTAIGGLGVDFGNVDSGALLHGGGTATYPLVSATASKNFLSYYVSSTATSGMTRGMYLRLYVSGGGQSADCLRAFTSVNDVVTTTVSGAHLSLNFVGAGAITGLGVASRSTLHVPNAAMAAGGTYAAAMAEIFCDGNSADISPTTQHSILRLLVDGGNATAQNLVKNLLSVGTTAGTDGTGNMIYTHTHAEGNAAGSLRILVNGAVKYLKFWDGE